MDAKEYTVCEWGDTILAFSSQWDPYDCIIIVTDS